MWGQKCKIIIFTVFSFAYNCLNLRVIVFSCLRMSQPRMDKPNTGFWEGRSHFVYFVLAGTLEDGSARGVQLEASKSYTLDLR